MKRYNYLLLLLLLLCFSCDSFLEEQPRVGANSTTYLTSYDKALGLLASSYAKLGDRESGIFGEERFMMPTDLQGGESQEARNFTLSPTSRHVNSLWKNLFNFVATANYTIARIEADTEVVDTTFSDSKLEKAALINISQKVDDFSASEMLLAEARFMRAYAYFTLYRYFGAVPILTEPTEKIPAFVPRAMRDEVFAFIEQDLLYAKQHCMPNIVDGVEALPFGRITKGSAAGLLAKAYIFQASYIRRAAIFGDDLEEAIGEVPTAHLYSRAIELCDSLINKQFGEHELVEYYPAVFTSANTEVLFNVVAAQGTSGGMNVGSAWGVDGSGRQNGAQQGNFSFAWHSLIYDFPTWGNAEEYVNIPAPRPPYESTYRGFVRSWGRYEDFANETSFTVDNAIFNTFDAYKSLSFTGDSTRRMWNVLKMYVTGNATDNRYYEDLEEGMWIFEPFGKYTEDENGNSLSSIRRDFFIEPLQGRENYDERHVKIVEEITWKNSYTMGLWMDEHTNGIPRTMFDKGLFKVGNYRMAKFRRPHPSDLPTSFKNEFAGVDYPVLRLAEMYLLKAEAFYFQGKEIQAIDELNKVRDRARHHANNFVDLFDYNGEAAYSYAPNKPMDIPTSLRGKQVLREVLLERARELCGEDDCRWFDISRYPDLYLNVKKKNNIYHNLERYFNPYGGREFWQKAMAERINTDDKIYKILLPIPQTEFQYFPDMRQNPGY